MKLPVYAWIYDGPVHSAFLASTMTLSILSNGLLIYIIVSTNSTSLGAYRYLLIVFALCDVATSLLHTALKPIVHMTDSGAYFFPGYEEMMIGEKSYADVFSLLFVATYYQTFLLLAYHFVFRYKAASRGIVRSFSDSWTFRTWSSLAVIIYFVYIAAHIGIVTYGFKENDWSRSLVPAEIQELYGINLRNPRSAFLVIAVQQREPVRGDFVPFIPAIVTLLTVLAFFMSTASVVIYCIVRTKDLMRTSCNKLSAKTRMLHLNLFNALLVQSAVPIVFSYLPLGFILVFPAITAISLGAFGNILYFITTIFPSIDAFFVLYFIRRFRTAVIRLFWRSFDTVQLFKLSELVS